MRLIFGGWVAGCARSEVGVAAIELTWEELPAEPGADRLGSARMRHRQFSWPAILWSAASRASGDHQFVGIGGIGNEEAAEIFEWRRVGALIEQETGWPELIRVEPPSKG